MDLTIQPGRLSGTVTAPPSKSMAHRMLICAALADKSIKLICPESSRDIDATVDCLNALGAIIRRTEAGFTIRPIRKLPPIATLKCGESGSTLRFLLPIVGALGVDSIFTMEGRLPERPLSPLWEEMERMGCHLTRPTAHTIHCTGKLRAGQYTIDGGVSSQFISGLLLALPLMGNSRLEITGQVQSRPYIDMTQAVMTLFQGDYPKEMTVEGDWSSAAFWLAANALGSRISVEGLEACSLQGDRAIADLLPLLQDKITISAADIPDLVPILAVVAAVNKGAVLTDIARLRLKESDRVASVIALLESLGGKAEATENSLTIHGTGLQGGTADACGDHRIAMAAAIAATVCKEPVTVLGAECVSKSYPRFWEEYEKLGGNYGKSLW